MYYITRSVLRVGIRKHARGCRGWYTHRIRDKANQFSMMVIAEFVIFFAAKRKMPHTLRCPIAKKISIIKISNYLFFI